MNIYCLQSVIPFRSIARLAIPFFVVVLCVCFISAVIGNESVESAKQAGNSVTEHKQISDLSIPGTKPGEQRTFVVNNVKYTFVWCPPGTTATGSSDSEKGRSSNEKHVLQSTKGFWMLETEVTLGMFRTFVNDTGYKPEGVYYYTKPYPGKGLPPIDYEPTHIVYTWDNPGFRQDDSHPVTIISWNDAVAFCSWLSKKTGQNIQLPTEVQWEYACQADAPDAFSGNLNEIAWLGSNSGFNTRQVGTKKPNAWGLYDMIGNVNEWCQDLYDDNAAKTVTDPTDSSSVQSNSNSRVYRGGSCLDNVQPTKRGYYNQKSGKNDVGFRVLGQ